MKKTGTRFLSILLTLVMALALLPTGPLTVEAKAADEVITELFEPVYIDSGDRYNSCWDTMQARTLTGMSPAVYKSAGGILNISVDVDTTNELMTALYWAQYYRDKTDFRYGTVESYVHFIPAQVFADAVKTAAPSYYYDASQVTWRTTFTINVTDDLQHDIKKETWHAGDLASLKAQKLGLLELGSNNTPMFYGCIFNYLDVDVIVNLRGCDVELCLLDTTKFIGIVENASFTVEGAGGKLVNHCDDKIKLQYLNGYTITAYKGAQMFGVSGNGALTLNNGTFECCSRDIDRWTDNLLTRVKGRDGNQVVSSTGGVVTISDSTLRFNYPTLRENYFSHGYEACRESSNGRAVTVTDGTLTMTNTTVHGKDAGKDPAKLNSTGDYAHQTAVSASGAVLLDGVTVEQGGVALGGDATVQNCDILCGVTGTYVEWLSSALSFDGGEGSSLIVRDSRVFSGTDNPALRILSGAVTDTGRCSVSLTNCEFAGFADNGLVQMTGDPHFYVSDTNLLTRGDAFAFNPVKDLDAPTCRARGMASLLGGLPTDKNFTASWLLSDGSVTSNNAVTVGNNFASYTFPMKHSTSEFITAHRKYPDSAYYSYSDYSMLYVSKPFSSSIGTLPNVIPSALPEGETWSVLCGNETNPRTEKTVELTCFADDDPSIAGDNALRLWVNDRDITDNSYVEIEVQQKIRVKDENGYYGDSWVPLTGASFYGPDSTKGILSGFAKNEAVGKNMYYMDIPTCAPGTYVVRLMLRHQVSGYEYTEPFTLTVQPYLTTAPVAAAVTDDNHVYHADTNTLRVAAGETKVNFTLTDPVSRSLAAYYANYGFSTGTKEVADAAAKLTQQNVTALGFTYALPSATLTNISTVSFALTAAPAIHNFYSVKNADETSTTVCRCYGTGGKTGSETVAIPAATVSYATRASGAIKNDTESATLKATFLPKAPAKPSITTLTVTDSGDAATPVYYGADVSGKRYDVYAEDGANFTFETSAALALKIAKLQNTASGGSISKVALEGFADYANEDAAASVSLNLLTSTTANTKDYAVTVGDSSQFGAAGYTTINDLYARIPAKDFKNTAYLRWRLAVTVRSSSGYAYTYYTDLFDVTRFGNFSDPTVTTSKGAEGWYPNGWDGVAANILDGPSTLSLDVAFRGTPGQNDSLELKWYRRPAGSAETGELVNTFTLTNNDLYETAFLEDQLHVDFPVSALGLGSLAAADYEFYPTVLYYRNGVAQGAAVNALSNEQNTVFTAHIDAQSYAQILKVKAIGGEGIAGLYMLNDSNLVPETNASGTTLYSFTNPSGSSNDWCVVLVEKEAGVDFECDWIVSDAKSASGIELYNSHSVATQRSTEPTAAGLVGALVSEYTSGGTEYWCFARRFSSYDFQVSTTSTTYQYSGETGATFGVYANLRRIEHAGNRDVVTQNNTKNNTAFVVKTVPTTNYEQIIASPPAMSISTDLYTYYSYNNTWGRIGQEARGTRKDGDEFPLQLRVANLDTRAALLGSHIYSVSVSWFGNDTESNTGGTLLATNTYDGYQIRTRYAAATGTDQSQFVLDKDEEILAATTHTVPKLDGPYVYAQITAYDNDSKMSFSTSTMAYAVPGYIVKPKAPAIRGLTIVNQTDATTATVPLEALLVSDSDLNYVNMADIPAERTYCDADCVFSLQLGLGDPGDAVQAAVTAYSFGGAEKTIFSQQFSPTDSWIGTGTISFATEGPEAGYLAVSVTADSDANWTTTADQTETVRYVPIRLESRNAYAPTIDRSELPNVNAGVYTTNITGTEAEGNLVYHKALTDWISPGTVTYPKHPDTQWAENGRRLALCAYAYDDNGNYFYPITEMAYDGIEFQKIDPANWYTQTTNAAQACFESATDSFLFPAEFTFTDKQNGVTIRPDGSVMLNDEALRYLMDASPSVYLCFIPISEIEARSDNTDTVAAKQAHFEWEEKRIDISAPTIYAAQSKDDYIGLTVGTGIVAEGKPTFTLELANTLCSPVITYTWYAYDLTHDTLEAVGTANSKAVITTEYVGTTAHILAKLPLTGPLAATLSGNYEIFCTYTYSITDNDDGGQKLCYGMAGIDTTDNQAPVFADAEQQSAVTATSFTTPYSYTVESYKALRTVGTYGTNVKCKAPAAAIAPNYIKVAESPSVPQHSDTGVALLWDWDEAALGIGTVNIEYTVTNAASDVLYTGSMNKCGKSVSLPVYTAAVGYYNLNVTATNYYAPSSTSAVQTAATIQYGVTAPTGAWKPVIEAIDDGDVALNKLPALSYTAALDKTNYDDGVLTYAWAYLSNGSYVSLSTAETLTGTQMQEKGINSVAEYSLRLTVTNTPKAKVAGDPVSSAKTFKVNVLANEAYAVYGTLTDEQAITTADIKIYAGTAVDADILAGTATALDASNNLDATTPTAVDGKYPHTYRFAMANGSYKVALSRSGYTTVIKAVTVNGAAVDLGDTVLVLAPVAPTGVTVTPKTITLTAKDETFTATAVVKPDAASQTVTWTSSNTAVATVSAATGVVTAVANGTATITATAGGFSDTCAVTVEIPSTPIGVMVSGTLTSYGASETTETTIQLYSGTGGSIAAEAAYETTVTGTGEKTYSIAGVAAGTYTMKVMKPNHVTRAYEITVDTDAITQDVKICLLGDVNMNGSITSADSLQILQYVALTRTFDTYQLLLADVNSKNGVTSADSLWILQRTAKIRDESYAII